MAINDERKAQSFKKQKLFVKIEKAENVFFELADRFWYEQNYQYNQSNCLDYTFNFVCALFDWNCPKKESWPDNFREFDIDMVKEYSKELNIKYCGGVRHPLLALDRQPVSLQGWHV